MRNTWNLKMMKSVNTLLILFLIFVKKKGIDENERKIGLLAYKFEKKMNRATTINGNQRF